MSTMIVGGYCVDRPAVEPDPDHGVTGDPLTQLVYDRSGQGWHLVEPHVYYPPGTGPDDR